MSDLGQELPRATVRHDQQAALLGAIPEHSCGRPRMIDARRAETGVDQLASRVAALTRHTPAYVGPPRAVIAAAENALAAWQECQTATIRCQHELDAAIEAAAESRQRLELLIRIAELSLTPPPTSVRPRRRFLGWLSSRKQPRVSPQLTPGAGIELARSVVAEPASATASAGGQALPITADLDHPSSMTRAPAVDIAVWLFGSFRLLCAGRAVDTRNGGKSIRVLKYLLAHHHQAVQKDLLVELFWPDADLDTVARCVHQTIYTIRRLLRDSGPDLDYILFADDAYLVNPALSFWCDVDGFESSILEARGAESDGRTADAVRAYGRAEHWYEGDYMADAPYEEWAPSERERLRLRYVDATNRLGDLHFGEGDLESATEMSQRVLHHEACDEEAHRRLIRCYAATGQRNLVIHQYRSYVASAERLYGLGPSPETTALYESIIAD